MIGFLARAVSGLPCAAHPGVLQPLLRQRAGSCQDFGYLQAACLESPCTSSSGLSLDGALAPSLSALPHSQQQLLLFPARHQHRLQQQPFPTGTSTPLPSTFLQPLQLQQLRAYRIPNRVAPPKVSYSERSGRLAPQPWPEFEVVKAPQGEIRWHRSVVRFPDEVTAKLEEAAPGSDGGGSAATAEQTGARTLVLSGKAGTIRLNLQEMDPTGLLAFRLLHLPAAGGSAGGSQQRSLLVLVSPNKARFDVAVSELNKAIRGVMTGYLVGLTVKGVGYRMEPVEDNTGEVASRVPKLTYSQMLWRKRAPGGAVPRNYFFESRSEEKQAVNFPYNKPASAVRLKVGYSRTVVYPLPPHIRAFCLKPTLLYLYGLELDELQRVAVEIRAIRKPNPYTGNGIQYLDEVVKLKQRARAK